MRKQKTPTAKEIRPEECVWVFDRKFFWIIPEKFLGQLREWTVNEWEIDDGTVSEYISCGRWSRPRGLCDDFCETREFGAYYYTGSLKKATASLLALGIREATLPKRESAEEEEEEEEEEALKPSDYYFGVLFNPNKCMDGPEIGFSPIKHWKEERSIPDWNFPLMQLLPKGFRELTDHTYSIPNHSVKEAIKSLQALGFKYHQEIEHKFNPKPMKWTW